MCFCANPDDSTSCCVGVINSTFTNNSTAGRKIRAGNKFHQFLDCGRVAVINIKQQRIQHFLKIMRRNVARHTDCNSGRTIGQQNWNTRGQDCRLFQGVVVIWNKINCVFFQVCQHIMSDFPHADFCITHCCRRITIN